MIKIRDIKFERKGSTHLGTQRQKGVRGAYESAYAEGQLTANNLLVKDSHAVIQKSLGTDSDVIAAVFSPSKVPDTGYVTTSGLFASSSDQNRFSSANASLVGIGVPIFSSIELNHMSFVGKQAEAYIKMLNGDMKVATLKSFTDLKEYRTMGDVWPIGAQEPEGIQIEAAGNTKVIRVVNFRFGAGNSSTNKMLSENVAELDPRGLTRDKWKYPNHPSTALMENVNLVMRRVYDDMQSALMNATGLAQLGVISSNNIKISAAFETVQPQGSLPPLAFNCRIIIEDDKTGDVARIVQMILAAQVDSMELNSVRNDLEVVNKYHRWLAS